MYIRLFAATDHSPVAVFALWYARALMAIAPLRVASLTGGFAGLWAPYASLMATPMEGQMINCVCGPPNKWTWHMKIEAPVHEQASPNSPARNPPRLETITGRAGLHTKEAIRNVMFFCDLPVDHHQTAELLKFECRITPVPAFRDAVPGSRLLPIPIENHAAFKELVLGTGSA